MRTPDGDVIDLADFRMRKHLAARRETLRPKFVEHWIAAVSLLTNTETGESAVRMTDGVEAMPAADAQLYAEAILAICIHARCVDCSKLENAYTDGWCSKHKDHQAVIAAVHEQVERALSSHSPDPA